MALVPRYHWYFMVAPAGVQAVTALRVLPTFAVPLILAVQACVPAATAAVAAEVTVAGVWAGADAVTRIDSALPTSRAPGLYVAPVAPAIGAPPRSHWIVVVTVLGFHVPVWAVKVWP